MNLVVTFSTTSSPSGRRLKELGEKYAIIYYSTMPRATETAQLVAESLPNVPTKSCDLLREGAPHYPDPPSKHWKPQHYVSIIHVHAHKHTHKHTCT